MKNVYLLLVIYLIAGVCVGGVLAAGGPIFGGSNITSIDSNGNIGIGSPNPTSMMDVWGTIRAIGFSGNGSELTNIPLSTKAFDSTTIRLNAYPVIMSGTVSSGTVVFQLTTDGTSIGTALFPNGVITNSVSVTPNDATGPYATSWVFSNSNKTLTVTVNKANPTGVIALLGINILGSPVAAANGTIVVLSVWGY